MTTPGKAAGQEASQQPPGHGEAVPQLPCQPGIVPQLPGLADGASRETVLTAVRRLYPRWQVWIVDRYIGGPVWCARLRTDHLVTAYGYTPHELMQAISERTWPE